MSQADPFLSISPAPGGRQSKYAINAFEVFDTETRSWTKFPNIPNKRAFSSFVPTEDKLFSLGGLRQGRLYRQPKFMRTVDMFDMEQGGGCPGSALSRGAGRVARMLWGSDVLAEQRALTCWVLGLLLESFLQRGKPGS